MDLNKLTIKEAQEKLRKKEITSVELTEACLAQIKKHNKDLNIFLTVCEKEALLAAKEADLRREKGEDGPLLGIPYAAKDNIMAKGVRTTAASKILEDYIAPYNATIIERLEEAGAILLGKVNLDEFAHGASTENSAFGVTHNPWDTSRVAGGSSGGSAAAVAAHMCMFALGTDTGGSIRCPASFCGVSGLKPSYGRSSRFGLIAMTSSTDVPGPLTKTVEDAAIVLSTIAGLDKYDATTVDNPVDEYANALDKDIKGKVIGLPKEFFQQGLEKEVKDSIDQAIVKFKELGAEIKEISLPHTKYAVPVYYIITPSEISSNLARFDGIRYGLSENQGDDITDIYFQSRGKGFGPEAKRRIMLGTFSLSAGYLDAYYLKAQKVRTVIVKEFDEVFNEVDLVITPTSPHPAFKIGERVDDPIKMYLEDVFVASASLAGLPAISIPAGYDNGLPVGMQLIGSRFAESQVFNLAHQYQKQTDWHKKFPKL